MKGVRKDRNGGVAFDLAFTFSFLFFTISSFCMFLDAFFALPAFVSLFIWLILALSPLRKKKVSARTLLKEHRLLSSGGLPLNSKLRKIYLSTLLVSLMLFFGMLLVVKEYYILLAFTIWLFIGYLTTEEIGGEESDERVETTLH
jgi:hypothetical protein